MLRYWVTNIFKNLPRSTKSIPPVPSKIWQDPLYFIGFGLGMGAIPFAPGTFATLMAIPFYLLMRPLPLAIYIFVITIFSAFSVWLSEKLSRNTDTHDHPGMCIDEFAGFFVTMIHAPSGWHWIALGVILFRFFDIIKPWPISYIDNNIHGGLGMILDDVVAGIFSCLIIQLACFFF